MRMSAASKPKHDAEDLRSDRDVDRRPERAHEHVVWVEQPLPDHVPFDRSQHRVCARYFLSRATALVIPHLATIRFIAPVA